MTSELCNPPRSAIQMTIGNFVIFRQLTRKENYSIVELGRKLSQITSAFQNKAQKIKLLMVINKGMVGTVDWRRLSDSADSEKKTLITRLV